MLIDSTHSNNRDKQHISMEHYIWMLTDRTHSNNLERTHIIGTLTFIYSVPLKYVVYRDCYCVFCLLTFIYSVPLKYVVYRDCYCVCCLLTFIYSVPLKYVVYRDCYCVFCPSLSPIMLTSRTVSREISHSISLDRPNIIRIH
jgi:hypothetical protein